MTMIAAAAVANITGGFLAPADHASIGASTAIFAGIGLLTALRQDWTPARWREVGAPSCRSPVVSCCLP